MGNIIITVEGGIATPVDSATGAIADGVTIIDFDKTDWSYDEAIRIIGDVLASDLDGPAQMRIIERVAVAVLKDWGER